MCFFLLCPGPIDKDTIEKSGRNDNYGNYLNNEETFDITMCQAPCKETCCCLVSGCPVSCLISQIKMRYKVLNHVNPGSGWDDYKCCQGYYGGCCCIQPGEMGEENCPSCCMCCEAVCCSGLSVSSTKFAMMDKYNLGLDDGDARLIHCNNCLQLAVCIARCVDCIVDTPATQCCENVLEIASCVFFQCITGCILAQVNHEIELRDDPRRAPKIKEMERY